MVQDERPGAPIWYRLRVKCVAEFLTRIGFELQKQAREQWTSSTQTPYRSCRETAEFGTLIMRMKLVPSFVLLAAALAAQTVSRPPAVPVVTHDPYFSIWSLANTLTAEPTRHWTGKDQPLAAIARIDDETFRFAGNWRRSQPPMKQVRLSVTATRTFYSFEEKGVRIDLTFLTPALADDLDILSRPVTYLSFDARSIDGKPHTVSIHFDAAASLAANTPDQRMAWSRLRLDELAVLRAGTAEQAVLSRSGDDLRIDWGYLYLAVPPQPGASTLISNLRLRQHFSDSGQWPQSDDFEPPAQTSRDQTVLAARFDLGTVTAQPVSRRLLLAYDDLFSIQYFHRNLRPWWRRKGAGIAELLRKANQEYDELRARCDQFDRQLRAELESAGGAQYADVAILAYRQALAAHKLVADLDGTPLYFSKENFSNGCIDTVDVTYPSAPLFLLLSPELLKAQLRPILDYAMLPRWPWPYAPHDLGQYPLANGQVYGGAEISEDRQMPVEESGNMLILTAALAKAEKNAEFAGRYWPVLTKWAEYLRVKGLDPENQLSTDDFAGHLAHNTNLSLKAILALGGYAQLARALGHTQTADSYLAVARQMASDWVRMADDGDHYRLAFDKQGTWSQKYNLVWDRLLGLNLFPAAVAEKEMAFYKRMQNRFGLPLDNRQSYTKLDWVLWTATLASKHEDFEALVAPVHRFLNETPTRVPMTDWYWTLDGRQSGFQARSVVGGVFIKALARRWASEGKGGRASR